MKSRVKHLLRPNQLVILLFSLFFGVVSAMAQTKTVTGTVVDDLGEGIIGATVLVTGSTSNGTITDFEGNFSLSNVPNNGTLHVSYIGYVAQDVSVAGKTNIKVTLSEDLEQLEEVVVVGYGVQKKSDVTGSMARIEAKELKSMPVKDALQGMQGKTAGVDITSSQRPGETGGINIRGVRSLNADQGPLYVVDGMVLQNGGIENLNPADIESIDILKDASATAVYGSRGANGVILVTTKKGKEGKVSINYSGTVAWEVMDEVTEYMSAAEWLDYARMAKLNAGTYKSSIGADGRVIPIKALDQALWGSVAASWANIEQAYDASGNYDRNKVGSYDWRDKGMQTGFSQDHNISVSGGNATFSGYASFGYYRQEGTQPGQEYERYTMKTSFEAKPLKYFTMGTSINAAFGDQDYGYSFQKSVTGAGDYYGALAAMLPWTAPYDADGGYIRNPAAGDVNIINPIRELQYNENNRKTFNVNGLVYGQVDFSKIWEPLEGLSYRIQFGPEFKFYEAGTFWNADGINGDGNNVAKWNHDTYRSWTLDNLIYYNREFADKHNLGVTLMQSASAYHHDFNQKSSTGVAMDTELWYNMGSGTYTLGTGYTETQMSSYMIRANYGFDDKYMLTASVRWDGSSVLAEGHKWATFPSAAVAWRLDREDFMESTQDWLSQAKVRFGYGVTGNSAIAAYSTKGGIQSLYYNWGTTNSSIGYVGSDASAKNPNKMANKELGWERTTQINLGVDYGFLANRINGSIDWYKTETDDLLMSMVIPAMNGYTSTYANVGRTAGWGLELQLNATAVKVGDFSWDLGVTWSKDVSEIKELSNGNKEDLTNNWFVGEEIGVFYDYVYDGIWKSDEAAEAESFGRKVGQIKIKDVYPDGKIDANDKQIIGKIRPDWSAGLTSTFAYKNWELSFFIFSRYGFDIRTGALTLDGRYMQRKIDYFVAGHNENADYYAPGINGESADTYQSAQNIEDGSFIKMRNISLGYNFTTKQLRKTGLSNCKIYMQAMNPFTIYSACDYLDTDLVSYANNTRTFGSATTSRSFVIGLNIGF